MKFTVASPTAGIEQFCLLPVAVCVLIRDWPADINATYWTASRMLCYWIDQMDNESQTRSIAPTGSSAQGSCGVSSSVFVASRRNVILVVVTKRISVVIETG